ncbi:MAG: hypothetical protein M1817_006267 [Caeruleum heppii]|nr:MAG: hypothetical protein M1817_006267 [Caeruleum heppii]
MFRPLVRGAHICLRCRHASTISATPAPPPMLLKIRADLKAAMKNKDTNRLNVLRALLADTTNAAKTARPIQTDLQLLALLRSRIATSSTSAAQFASAGRADLQEKEAAQITVLEEYASGVDTVPEAEVTRAVEDVIASMKQQGQRCDMGAVLKKVLGAGGHLEGKPVERGDVARVVKHVIGG